ncbi:hypothetical protein EP837_01717 [Sphingobium sp. EP60837]|nr:hypothetical protein EP837_01717 [Sphingobium sp. EP60837]
MARRWDEKGTEADGPAFPNLVALEAIIIGGLILLGTGMMLVSGVRWLFGLFG